jgi:hypothetical protein
MVRQSFLHLTVRCQLYISSYAVHRQLTPCPAVMNMLRYIRVQPVTQVRLAMPNLTVSRQLA